jgi:hypothetical protein
VSDLEDFRSGFLARQAEAERTMVAVTDVLADLILA